MTDLPSLACQDCVPQVTHTTGTSSVTGGPVLVVTVVHAESCPWIAKYAPEDMVIAPTPDRVLRHCRGGVVE